MGMHMNSFKTFLIISFPSSAILAGLIDEPFYSMGGPRYINYGSLGTVIGHEITHGYDTKGRSKSHLG
jgi:predicted metalloendopeptidase